MTTVALLLVLGSAVCHASWNFLLKQSEHKTAFLWSFGVISFGLFLAPALASALVEGIGWRGVLFGAVSSGLHGVYGLALSRSYHLGDLSAVYPISRGMGPALVPLAAVLLLGERVSAGAGVGIALVVLGIYVVNARAVRPLDVARPLLTLGRPETRVALLTGVLIASYSLWDKAALDHLPPLALNQFAMAGHALVLAPLALRDGALTARGEWRQRRSSILVAGVLAPLAYVLVLAALTTSRVSYVAPAREVGIVLGTLLGVLLLREGYGASRLLGSALIVAGVLALGLAP